MQVKELNIYPIKGCKGMSVASAACQGTGLPYDRHWMVVAEDTGKFITQRQVSKLCLVSATLPQEALLGSELLPGAALTVTAPGMPQLQVPLTDTSAAVPPSSIRRVNVWEWTGSASDEGDEAAAWFSRYLGRQVRLVRHLGSSAGGALLDTVRPTDPEFAPGHEVKFADGFPLLVGVEENLVDLSSRLGETLPMNRFRPNIIVSGAATPWEDDTWKGIQISRSGSGAGGVVLQYVKPCDRCKVPTIDQETAETGHDKLEKVLKEVRSGKALGWSETRKSWTHSVFFGWNAAVKQQGQIAVGDTVAVVEVQA